MELSVAGADPSLQLGLILPDEWLLLIGSKLKWTVGSQLQYLLKMCIMSQKFTKTDF